MTVIAKRQLMLKLLANRFEKDQGTALFQMLSEPEKSSLEAIETGCDRPEILLPHLFSLFYEQHYSWLIAPLQTFSSPLQEMIIRALPSRIRPFLEKALNVSVSSAPIPLPFRRYLLSLLWDKIETASSLHLPEPSSFDFLLAKSKKELVLITEFLGLQEVAESLRTIVDKNILQKVLHSVHAPAKGYLLHCLSQKRKAHLSKKIDFYRWDGSFITLNKLIMLRGIKKLGIALSGQPASFLWRLMRKFDIGRGNLLKKYLHKEAIPNATELFAEEVKNIHLFITNKRKA